MQPSITADSPLILASSSRHRAGLLRRLRVPFEQEAADVDETSAGGEAPSALAQRLARLKAQTLAQRRPGRWILGADQVCACDGQLLGKPGARERALHQLAALSGRSAQFFTAIALTHAERALPLTALDLTTVRFRVLGPAEIERYVAAEPAYDCAGSFMCEGLGISLFEAVHSEDPSGLIGLPLIALRRLLAQAGLQVP